MFGAIFEDHTDVGGDKGGTKIYKASNDSLSKPRSCVQDGGTGLVGITNQGATCYLNSLIQTLLFTPELRDAVFSLAKEELGQPSDNNYRCIPSELQMLFASMLLLDQANLSTTKLTNSFGWNNQEDLCQQDVQELNRILFSALEESLIGLTGANIIRDLYGGAMVNKITCSVCGHVSDTVDHFQDLTVAVSGYSSLIDSLTDCYLNPEFLSGNNQYRCSSCEKLVDAVKEVKLRVLPPVLTFCLLRLTFDFQTLRRQKETSKFEFPHEISMGAYMEAETDDCLDYELFSVVVHRGGAHGGHYHALIKDIDELGHWTKPHRATESSEKVQSKKGETEYLRFDSPEELLDHILLQETDWISTDQLSQKIQQETGVTWNKRFKKRYQTLTKFLTNNPERYLFDEVHRQVRSVFVTETVDVPLVVDNSDVPCEDLLVDEHWFALDDRKVRSANKWDAEKYSGGKECAYMLYYRRKSLVRPPEAKSNLQHLIPPHIVESINDTNSSLKAEREAEELRLNTVDVKVYLPTEYTFRSNFITSKSGHKHMEISFDQRKTVEEFVIHLHDVMPEEEILCEDSHLYVVKCTHNALHLLDDLSDESWCGCTLALVGLHSSRGLLFLPKSVIEKHQVPCGLEHEPYQLTFVYESTKPELLIAKSLSLQELPALVMNVLSIEPPIYLYSYAMGTQVQVEIPTTDNVALERHVKDSSTITVSHEIIVSNGTTSSKIKLFVEGELEGMIIEACSFSVEPTDPISSVGNKVKKFINSRHKPANDVQFRLRRTRNNTADAPLYHDRTVKECHLADGDTIMVEKGAPALSSQMILYYQLKENDKSCHSIVCKCTQTVSQAIQQMVEEAGLDGIQYYIMTVDWIGEPSDVVYNTNGSLAKAKIKNGDNVILVEGTPPPKDAVTVSIKWSSNTSVTDSYIQWLVNSMDDLTLADSDMKARRLDYSSWSTEVSRTTTIGEIKCLLLSAISGECVVDSANCIRLRGVNGYHPGAIYKDHQKTMEQYKLRGRMVNMLAELLPDEELLRDNEMILSLRQKNLLTGDYELEQTFTWKMPSSAAASHLRRELATYLQCPVNLLHLALFVPEHLQWRLINDSAKAADSNRSKRGKSKAALKQQEINLKKAPYNIEDGDLIGYIIAADQQETVTEEYFQTTAEQQLRQMSTEKKREQRSEKASQDAWLLSTENSDSGTGHSKEKAISIRVGNFT